MADEINRASPRTQSALLQAMQEGRVSVAGQYHPLPQPVPCAGDAEPAGAGRHLSAARGAARPLPAADRCRLSRSRRRAADAARHHRHRRATRSPPVLDRRRADRGAAPGAAHPGRRKRGRGDPGAGALRPARRELAARGEKAYRLGAGTARQPGADAGVPRARAAGRAVRALGRRRRGAGAAGAAPPHGAQLRRPRRRRRHGAASSTGCVAPFR